jgi:UDP-N-acetylmuramyl pentapeptide phosphotransferase/UDP-N-acetylglucosamine-1-phosphate transferase
MPGVPGTQFIALLSIVAATSAALTFALLPALRRHALAHPNARSSHRVATPQGGGIAVIVATLGASAAFGTWEPASTLTAFWMVFAATSFIAIVGAIDDLWTIEVLPRLMLHAIAVGVAIASLPVEMRVLPIGPWWLERALLLVAGLWFVNLTNFMDGIDLMTVAEFVPMTAGLVVLGSFGALPAEGMVVATALCGGLIGFAPFNWPVARIFLGDVGSLPIGLLAGWLLALLAGHGHIAAALILPLYYLADATITLGRRVSRGERFWQAHRTHFYQRATDRGHTVAAIVARVFTVNVALVALAAATVVWPGRLVSGAALAGAAALVAALLISLARSRA